MREKNQIPTPKPEFSEAEWISFYILRKTGETLFNSAPFLEKIAKQSNDKTVE